MEAFRTKDIVAHLRGWTGLEWEARIPQSLRDDLWADRPPCTSSACRDKSPTGCWCPRTPIAERDLLCSQCATPRFAVGPIFFHVAAIVAQLGVLLLVQDQRHSRHTQYSVYDFGTKAYPFSMIIYGLFPRPRAAQSNGIGHYETVGVSPAGVQHHQLLFANTHPLLCVLRDYAESHASAKTLDHERLLYYHFPACLRASPDTARPGTPPSSRISPMVLTSPHPPSSELAAVLPSMPRAAVRQGRRIKRPSTRLSDITCPTPLSRSGTARAGTRRDAPPPTPRTHNGGSIQRSRSVGARPFPRSQPTPTRPASTAAVAAAPPLVPSERHHLMSQRVLANVRDWVRRVVRRGRLASRIHFSSIPLWTVRCSAVLQALAASLRSEPMDERAVVGQVCALWMLPAEVLTVPARGGGGAGRRQNRQNRLRRRLEDDGLVRRLMATALRDVPAPDRIAADGADSAVPTAWATVEAMLHSFSAPVSATFSRPRRPHATLAAVSPADRDRDVRDSKLAQRAERLFAQGHAQRAMQALASTTELADLDVAAERDTLRQLHPPALGAMPCCPADAPEVVVSWDWMEAEMRASDTGAAPGPSGWGSNYLSVLASDPHCVQALAFFIQQIVNNRLPDAVRVLLTTSFVVSLDKGGGGRRPIAVGDVFCRLASRYAEELVYQRAQQAMAPHQYGVGQPDGCTQIVQSLQHLLLAPGPSDASHPRPLACLSIDVANAFNSLDRAEMLHVVYSNPDLAQCWRMVDFAYGKPSLLLMRCDDTVPDSDAFIESQMGVRQGDPLAAMLFSLTMHRVYDAVARTVSKGCHAFVDDGHLSGTVAECWQAWELLPSLLSSLGLRLNTAKCELTCFRMASLRHDADLTALSCFRSAGVVINDSTLRLLGCVIGADGSCVRDRLRVDPHFRADQLAAFRRLPLIDKHFGMQALQRLTGTVLTNRLRAMPPAVTLPHAAAYDARVFAAARLMIGITAADGDKYDSQLRLPLSLAGFGLTSATSIAPAAYLAGAEVALRHSPTFADVWAGSSSLDPHCALSLAIQDSLSRVAVLESTLAAQGDPTEVSQLAPSVLPRDADTFVAHFRAKPPCLVQASVMHRITTLMFIAMLTRAGRAGATCASGVEEVARLNSLRAAESSLWLHTLPTDPGLRLTDVKWQWAARLRLGMPVPQSDVECAGCRGSGALAADSWHALACVPLSGDAITARHNAVLQVLARFCNLLLVPARIEPAQLSADTGKRPDIQIDLPDLTLLSDVTITHPSTKSWRLRAARRGIEAVGDRREATKSATYAAMAAEADMQFIPFVLYSYGGFHSSALKVINLLADALDPACCLLSRSEWKEQLMRHIAIAVQRGNANIMIQASQRSRHRLSHRPRHAHLIPHFLPNATGRGTQYSATQPTGTVCAGSLCATTSPQCAGEARMSDIPPLCQPLIGPSSLSSCVGAAVPSTSGDEATGRGTQCSATQSTGTVCAGSLCAADSPQCAGDARMRAIPPLCQPLIGPPSLSPCVRAAVRSTVGEGACHSGVD